MREREAEILKHYYRRRIARGFGYLGLSLAGLFVIISPSQLVENQVGHTVALCWGIGLFVSASSSLWGTIRGEWFPEYTWLPLLFSVLILYGFSILFAAGWNVSPLFAFGLFFLSFGAAKIARWQDVRDIKQAAEDHNQWRRERWTQGKE